MLRLAIPLKVMVQRFAFALFVVAAASLLILAKADIKMMEKVRTAVTDMAAPVLGVLSQPVVAANDAVDGIESLIDLREENARLREQNTRLLHWQAVARRLEQENARYRSLLQVQFEPAVDPVVARVIADSGGPFVRTVLVNAGRRAGVRKGQAVVNDDGLVGRIVESGERSSRVLLVTDLNSRIPVIMEIARHRAILAGDNSARPRLEFLPVSAQVSPGDRVVTSGDGGLFPPGLPVGIVADLGDGLPRVQPFADRERIEYVRVLRFDLPRLSAGQADADMVKTDDDEAQGNEAQGNKAQGNEAGQ
jgi:rod shape-determining protein MreC